MVVRFFMLQAHYRSTLDLTDDALQAAEKGYNRLMETYKILSGLDSTDTVGSADAEVNKLIEQLDVDMCDDFSTPKALATLFEMSSKANAYKGGQLAADAISSGVLQRMKDAFKVFLFDIFGLKEEQVEGVHGGNGLLDGLMNLIIDIRKSARDNKDWTTADKIRDTLADLSVQLKDGKDGTSWTKT